MLLVSSTFEYRNSLLHLAKRPPRSPEVPALRQEGANQHKLRKLVRAVDNTLFFRELPSHKIVRGSSFDAGAISVYSGS